MTTTMTTTMTKRTMTGKGDPEIPMSTSTKTLWTRAGMVRCGLVFALGLVAGGLAICGLSQRGGSDVDSCLGDCLSRLPSVMREAHADLEEGEYAFFPNRRSVWVVNRTNGRMANYHFHDDDVGSVDRSRVTALDTRAFPAKDTVMSLSDRNLNNILWVCNTRTGDVQMWTLARDGTLKGETPVACSTDLTERVGAKASKK